jgi:hypothetical protein
MGGMFKHWANISIICLGVEFGCKRACMTEGLASGCLRLWPSLRLTQKVVCTADT